MDRFLKILIVSGIVAYISFVFAVERHFSVKENEILGEIASIVAPSIWQLDQKIPEKFLRFVSKSRDYEQVRIFENGSDGKEKNLFLIKNSDAEKGVLHTALDSSFYYRLVSVPIIHKGNIVGTLEVSISKFNFLYNFIIGLVIFLSLAIAYFYKIIIDSKNLLEERILDRTTQIIKSETKLKTIIDSSENGIIAINENKIITTINSYAKSLLCGDDTSPIGRPLSDIFTIQSAEKEKFMSFADVLEREAQFDSKIARKCVLSCINNDEILISLNVSPIVHNMKEDGTVVAFRDITEEDRIEKQFRQSQKMEAVGQLAGGIAHDFNNLLQVILGHGEFVEEALSQNGNSDDIESWEQVMSAGKKARELVSKILLFSREKRELVMKQVNLNKIVTNLLKMIKRILEENIKVKFIGDPILWRAKCNVGHLEQALMNLCVNARDAMKNGGTLKIELANAIVDAKSVTSFSITSGKFICCKVSDTGEGISPQHLEKIFEPFFTTKGIGKGTGLGLATVYNVAKQHSGFVDVSSEIGVGTTFKLYIPAISENEVTLEEETEQTFSDKGSGECILFAEDQIEVRALIVRILKKAGYKVLQAKNGIEAVDIFLAHKEEIDLLLFDVIMPEMSGWDAAKKILVTKPELPIIFCSGYTDQLVGNDIECSMIEKPFNKQELLKKIKELIS